MLRLLIFILVFSTILLATSCNFISSELDFNKFKISKWGPDVGKVDTIPNIQPSGKMGLWIDVPSTEGYGELQIIFNGEPCHTSTQLEHVTAGVDPELLKSIGEKKVELKQLSTGKIITVGIFKVTP